jgi:5-methylcytosine-specific restriction endonuclease McrA
MFQVRVLVPQPSSCRVVAIPRRSGRRNRRFESVQLDHGKGSFIGMSTTEQQARYLKRRRDKAKAFLGGKCASCASTTSLEFDHIEPSTKEIDISSAIALHWSWNRLMQELTKCQLLCKSCHVEKTRKDKPPVKCGSYWTYKKHGCRCAACTAANSARIKRWKDRAKNRARLVQR